MTASTRPPAGMPPHLWELAKSDSRGAVPERVRRATDNGASAPAVVRTVARRAATASATLGIAAAVTALGASPVSAGPAVDTLASDGHGAPPGPGVEAPGGHGPGGAGGFGDLHTSHHAEGSPADGPVSSGHGTTFRVEHPEAPGPQHTLSVSIFQDVTVVETADGNFQVDAYQFIVIRDSQGHEYVFTEHYQVTVPDPPGQETDLSVHETGRVQIVENPDGSFTPIGVDHGIVVTVGSDGNGRDDVHIRQDESVQVDEHGRPDPHDTTVVLGENATSTTHDLDDPAFTSIDQSTTTGLARTHPAPVGGPTAPTTAATPVVFSGPTPAGPGEPFRDPVFDRPTGPVDHGPFHGPPDPGDRTTAGTDPAHDDGGHHDGPADTASHDSGDIDDTGGHDTSGHDTSSPDTSTHDTSSHETGSHEAGSHETGHETDPHTAGPHDGSDGGEHLVHATQLH